jgi:hypothetical protein
MPKMKTFGSSSTGDISGFEKWFREWDETVSFTVDDGINLTDTSYFKVLHQIEPAEVLDVAERIIVNHKFYDLILAWDKRILAACPNAVLFPQGNCTWMDPNFRPWETWPIKPLPLADPHANPMECDISLKKFQVSFITSSKVSTTGHRLRQEIYEKLPSCINGMPVFKHRSPPYIPSKRALLDEYQYFITPQNASQENWFDDKIIDALVAKTIPLYWGCPNLGDFFNMDGILHFKTYDEMLHMLENLTPTYYAEHYAAVQDNFERAMRYIHIWHRAEVEIEKGLERKRKGGLVTSAPVIPPFTKPHRPIRRPLSK